MPVEKSQAAFDLFGGTVHTSGGVLLVTARLPHPPAGAHQLLEITAGNDLYDAMMRRMLSIPREPVARLRALALWFVLLVVAGTSVSVLATAATPTPFRIAAPLAGAALVAWCVWGYRRDGFPAMGWLIDAALVFVISVPLPIAFRGLALFYALVQFRALYVPQREIAGLVLAYSAAR